jgi:hypothetical protein
VIVETEAIRARVVVAAAIAVAGGVIGLALTPPMASTWAYDPPSTSWASMHWVERTFGPTLESWGALSFGWSALGPYEIYGKGFFLVYVAMAPIVRLVHHGYRARGSASKWEVRTWPVMWSSLIACAAADFVSYWGVSVPGPVGEALFVGGFVVELIASAMLLLSTTMYGAISLRLHIVPAWTSLSLVAAIPLAVVMLEIVVAYIPNGYVVPISLIWAAYGVTLLVPPTQLC